MKKFLLVIILFCSSLLGCNEKHEHIDADTNGICDICKYTMTIGGAFEFEYVATENGHCSHKVGEACDGTCIKSPHEDLNHDNKCDICGFSYLNSMYNEICDPNIINGLLNISLDYELYVPDMQLSYKFLWDGYDLENKFGPNIPESERFYTYLTEYKECDNKFYLVYLKENIITAYMKWLKEYEEQESPDINNYHFSSYNNGKIIDGKYFYGFQKSNEVEISSNIKFYEVDDINDIVYKFNDYQLVLCAQSKKAIIKENLSTNTTINKEIILFNKYVLYFEDELSAPQHYLFDNNEKYNQNQLNKMFTYVGEMIESFPITYEEIEFSCFPILGLGKYWFYYNIRAEVLMVDGRKLILLPRYIISGDEYLDLLSYETNLFFEEDVFREYKELFSSAFVAETAINESFYLWGLYDYSIVASIIAN